MTGPKYSPHRGMAGGLGRLANLGHVQLLKTDAVGNWEASVVVLMGLFSIGWALEHPSWWVLFGEV